MLPFSEDRNAKLRNKVSFEQQQKKKKKKSCHLHDNFMKWDIPETVDVEILRESQTGATRMKVISSGWEWKHGVCKCLREAQELILGDESGMQHKTQDRFFSTTVVIQRLPRW